MSSQTMTRRGPRPWVAVNRLQRLAAPHTSVELITLVVGTLLLGAVLAAWPDLTPLNLIVIPMVLGSLVLGPRELPWFVVFLLAVFALGVMRQETYTTRTIGAILVIFVLGLIVMLNSFRRSRLGVAGVRGESMFVDLRDRIQRQGQLPDLPAGWRAETAVRSAGGTKFSGDFVVAARRPAENALDVVVVDVSGKGAEAGTRALLLSGAFSGLLAAVPAAGFLPTANEYLLRQDWDEGFATAVHLTLDLTSGHFEVRTAGHPPAVQLRAGSGRWQVHEGEGPVLGLVPDVGFHATSGRMDPGDVLMLYTDGLVETPTRDLDSGIDRLLGHGDRLAQRGFSHGGAGRLVDQLGSSNDDCALVLLQRL